MTRRMSSDTSIVANFTQTDYSFITVNSNFRGMIARCVTGLGPIGNDNGELGDWYFNGTKVLPFNDCAANSSIKQRGATISNHVGAVNLVQCPPFTTTAEGIYTCMIMNSSMIYETMRLGVYLGGRSKSLDTVCTALL